MTITKILQKGYNNVLYYSITNNQQNWIKVGVLDNYELLLLVLVLVLLVTLCVYQVRYKAGQKNKMHPDSNIINDFELLYYRLSQP